MPRKESGKQYSSVNIVFQWMKPSVCIKWDKSWHHVSLPGIPGGEDTVSMFLGSGGSFPQLLLKPQFDQDHWTAALGHCWLPWLLLKQFSKEGPQKSTFLFKFLELQLQPQWEKKWNSVLYCVCAHMCEGVLCCSKKFPFCNHVIHRLCLFNWSSMTDMQKGNPTCIDSKIFQMSLKWGFFTILIVPYMVENLLWTKYHSNPVTYLYLILSF